MTTIIAPYADITPADIRQLIMALDREPMLTVHGLGVQTGNFGMAAGRHHESFRRLRAALRNEDAAFAASLVYLRYHCRRRKTPNPRVNSYAAKHAVERMFDDTIYIPEGALIAAAIAEGINYKAIPLSTSVMLAISEKKNQTAKLRSATIITMVRAWSQTNETP